MTSGAEGTSVVPEVRFRTIDGVCIRYADRGGSQEPARLTAVTVPGNRFTL
jgi:hypothetical protein